MGTIRRAAMQLPQSGGVAIRKTKPHTAICPILVDTAVTEGINMFSKRLATSLLITLGLASSALSQDTKLTPEEEKERARIGALLQSSRIHIDGKKNPEKVSYALRMQMFFEGIESGSYVERLKRLLSSADLAILTEFSSRHKIMLTEQSLAYEAAWMDIAARAQDMEALDLAKAQQAATDKTQAWQADQYRSVVARLTTEGQKVVGDFAFENVRPQISTEDPFVVARADPTFYKNQFLAAYEMYRSGNWPPSPPKRDAVSTGTAPASTTSTEAKIGKSPP